MNHDNERKAFKEWVLTHPDNLDLTAYEENIMFDAWLASANREGYKLVPVEPKFETMQEMNVAIIENISETPKYRMQQVYKAMIRACDE